MEEKKHRKEVEKYQGWGGGQVSFKQSFREGLAKQMTVQKTGRLKGKEQCWYQGEVTPSHENSKWKPEAYLLKSKRSSVTEAERKTEKNMKLDQSVRAFIWS